MKKSIGHRIRERREQLGWTQTYLAQHTGYTRVYINKLEKQKIKDPGIEAITKIARALGIEVNELCK